MAFNEQNKSESQILALTVLADESDNYLSVSAVKFYRSPQKFADNDGETIPFSDGAAGTTCNIQLGSVPPPPYIIKLVSTFQA